MSLGAIAADTRNAAPEQAGTAFSRDGVIGPIRLFTAAQCQIIVDRLRRKDRPAPAEWTKGHAVTDRFWYELATQPSLISLLRSLIGNDIILWGARTIERNPGQTHTWHSDIESCAPDGRFVSVWVGIENTSQDSALQVVTRSHLAGRTIQQVLQERGLRRGEVSAEQVLAFARDLDAAAQLRQPAMGDGEMLVYDGRLWHGSHNARDDGKRTALLLQYAAAHVSVRMPDFKQLEWPFRYLDAPRPPVVVVSGTAGDGANRVVPAPPPNPEELSILSSGVHPVPLPLAEDPKKRCKSHRIVRGRSSVLDFFNCHVSILSAGYSPHPPHAHAEEEVLIILEGEAQLVISNSPAAEEARIETVRPGAFVYYPPFQHHTIRNAGPSPVSYLMFKWRGGASRAGETLATGLFHYGDVSPDAGKGYWTKRLIRDPTPYLARLGCHLTVLQAGKGYRPHSDAYDVAILLLAGEVETLGQRVTASSVIYYAAGEPHGMRNVGDRPARYLVFEFHASAALAAQELEARSEPPPPARNHAVGGEQPAAPNTPPPRKPAGIGRQLALWLGALGRKRPSDPSSGAKAARADRKKPTKGEARRNAGGSVVPRGSEAERAVSVCGAALPRISREAKIEAKRKKLLAKVRRETVDLAVQQARQSEAKRLGPKQNVAARKHVGSVIRRAREQSRAGDLEGALAVYLTAPASIRKEPRIKAKRKKIVEQLRRKKKQALDSVVKQARQLRRAGDLAGAVAFYESASTTLQENVDSRFAYACLLKKTRRLSDAYEAFRAVLKLDPARQDAWFGAGSTLVRLGWRDELAALIDEMLTGLPASSEVLMRAASMAQNGNLQPLASSLIDRALSVTNQGPRATLKAAELFLKQGEQGRVLRLLDRADIRSDAKLESQAFDLQGLAHAQLRLAAGAPASSPVRENTRADVMAVEHILQHDGKAQYQPVKGGIAIVLSSLGPGGIQTQLVHLLNRLRNAGQGRVGPMLLLLTNRSKLEPAFHRSALTGVDVTIESISDFDVRLADVVAADIAGRIGVLSRPMATRIAYLIDRLRSHRPEVVLAMGDVVGVPVMLAASIAGVPRVAVSARGEPPLSRGVHDTLSKPAYQAALRRKTFALSANSFATSRSFAEWLEQPADCVRTIHNAVDVDRLLALRDTSATAAHRQSLNIPPSCRVVGSVFNYRREKRPELWIEAAAIIAKRAPDVVFVTVGNGHMFNDFTTTLRRLGLEGRFHRPGTRRDVVTWLELMDVFLLTSRNEGTPNALLEAQALGHPVVATAVGGSAETFLADQTGILLSPNPSAEEVADAVMRVLNDPGFAARAKDQGPRFVRQRFGVDRMVSEFLEVSFGPDAARASDPPPQA